MRLQNGIQLNAIDALLIEGGGGVKKVTTFRISIRIEQYVIIQFLHPLPLCHRVKSEQLFLERSSTKTLCHQ